MTRLQTSAQLQKNTPQASSAIAADRELQEAEARVREQEAHVLRLIVRGAPTQTAEDLLRQFTAAAKAMKERRLARR